MLFSFVMHSPYRFLLAAALVAALLCLFPVKVDAPQALPPVHAGQGSEGAEGLTRVEQAGAEGLQEAPVHADLTDRTSQGCYLHKTITYTRCGHSVQRRTELPAQLVGLSRTALEAEIGKAIPGAVVTGFSSVEVDAAQRLDMPCPLHWMLRAGESGNLLVLQNRTGEEMSVVRETDAALDTAPQADRQTLLSGMVFDEVQALEGYLESLGS